MRDKASVKLKDLQETNNCIVKQRERVLGIQSEKDALNKKLRELDNQERQECKKLEDMENELYAEEKERYSDPKHRKVLVDYAMSNRKVVTGNLLKPFIYSDISDDEDKSRLILNAFWELDLEMQQTKGERVNIFEKVDVDIRNFFQKQPELEK